MCAGIIASFASTLASQQLIRVVERDRALWPYAAYRIALATVVAIRMAMSAERDQRTSELTRGAKQVS
jgi:undecaprenyl pyrophosphate phosphatase UppP